MVREINCKRSEPAGDAQPVNERTNNQIRMDITVCAELLSHQTNTLWFDNLEFTAEKKESKIEKI